MVQRCSHCGSKNHLSFDCSRQDLTYSPTPGELEEEVPKSQCPQCKAWVKDPDGFGVLAHLKPAHADGCGYCSHPTRTSDTEGAWDCGLCGHRELAPEKTFRSRAGLALEFCEETSLPCFETAEALHKYRDLAGNHTPLKRGPWKCRACGFWHFEALLVQPSQDGSRWDQSKPPSEPFRRRGYWEEQRRLDEARRPVTAELPKRELPPRAPKPPAPKPTPKPKADGMLL